MLFLVVFDFYQRIHHLSIARFSIVISLLIAIIFLTQYLLFRKSAELAVAKKERYQEENRHIFERIQNLEYIKVISGEKLEEEKLNNLLDKNFEKNKQSLL